MSILCFKCRVLEKKFAFCFVLFCFFYTYPMPFPMLNSGFDENLQIFIWSTIDLSTSHSNKKRIMCVYTCVIRTIVGMFMAPQQIPYVIVTFLALCIIILMQWQWFWNEIPKQFKTYQILTVDSFIMKRI